MPPADDLLVGRYDSLDALFCALNARTRPLFAGGGYTRVHPALLTEKTLADYIAVRKRLATFGLRLIVTPAVGPEPIELRRYATPHEPALGGRSPAGLDAR